MASYLQQPAYNTYQTQGYQLPAQQIIAAINAKSQYYLQTAQQLKNQYDTTFDFNLSNEANKNSLKQQQASVDSKMKDLVKKDLTISDNSSAIRGLIKPIMQNTSYIADEQLTNKIQSGFRDAQSDLKKKGSDHYNIKSIQVLNNTLQDWSKDDPANIDRYTGDTLGTTYQPYDPSIDKEFNKTIQDRVKSGKIKVDVKDGQGNIITQEYSDINSLQAQDYIRSIRPQQQSVQDQLEAKIYSNAMRKASPEERGQLVAHVQGIQNYNINRQVGFIEAEKHKVETQYALLPKEEQEKSENKKSYEAKLSIYDDGIKKAQEMYKDYDASAYFDLHKKNVAENQLQTVLSQRSINGIVDGMGLESNSRTMKSDTSFWNAQNLVFNERKFAAEQEYRKMELSLKASMALAKAEKEKKATPDVGDNIQPASDVASIGTAGLPEEEQIQLRGKEIQKTIAGEIEAKKSDVAGNLFSKLNVMVKTGLDNEDFYSALGKMDSNQSIGGLLSSLSGGNETNKKFIIALINEGAKKVTNGRFYKDTTIPTLKASEVKINIKAALDDPAIFNAAVKKAGFDTGDFNTADYVGYQKGQIAFDEKTQAQTYANTYKQAASLLPVPGLKDRPFEQLKHYDEGQYVRDISPQLKAQGFTDRDIMDFGRYLKGEEVNNSKVRSSASTSSPYDDGLSPFTGTVTLNPLLDNAKRDWVNYQKTLNKGLTSISTGASSYNTKTFSIVPKIGTDFDPARQYVKGDFITLINNNSTQANLKGETQNAEFLQKVRNLVSSDKDVIAGFSPYSDGKNNFITLNISKSTENDKIIKSFGLDPEDLINTKIQIDNTAISKLGFKPQSGATSELQRGRIFGSTLQSGKTFSFYNSGTAATPNVAFDGSLLVPAYDENTGTFAIREATTANFVKSARDNAIQEGIANGHADKAASYIYGRDAEAKRISDILDKYKIDYKDKNLIFAQLPPEVKEELRNNTTSFKNRKD